MNPAPISQREEAAEFFNRTSAGGVITLVSALFMALLFFSELRELADLVVKTHPSSRRLSGAAAAHDFLSTSAAGGLAQRGPAVAPRTELGPACTVWMGAPAAGLFTKVTTVNELSVDTSRGEMLDIHVRGGQRAAGAGRQGPERSAARLPAGDARCCSTCALSAAALPC